MKNIIIAAVMAATALFATSASAKDFTGARVEVNASVDDVTKARDTNSINYGAAVGIDAPLFGSKSVIVGVEAQADNMFNYRDYGVGARLGIKVSPSVLAYGKVGYADFRGLSGVRVGGGLEYAVTNHLYAKIEYRYSDLERSAHRHQALIGAGIRF